MGDRTGSSPVGRTMRKPWNYDSSEVFIMHEILLSIFTEYKQDLQLNNVAKLTLSLPCERYVL